MIFSALGRDELPDIVAMSFDEGSTARFINDITATEEDSKCRNICGYDRLEISEWDFMTCT